MNCKLLLIIY